jgi:hypothetical protein
MVEAVDRHGGVTAGEGVLGGDQVV